MERNVKEFLRETGADALEARRVLYANKRWGYLLQGTSVEPLIQLMRDQGITNLVSADRKWAITVDGWFRNPLSRGSKEGWIKCLAHPKNVFLNQNTWIKPVFQAKAYRLEHSESGRVHTHHAQPGSDGWQALHSWDEGYGQHGCGDDCRRPFTRESFEALSLS